METQSTPKVLNITEWYCPVFSGVAIRLGRFTRRLSEKNIHEPHIVTRSVGDAPLKEKNDGIFIERIKIRSHIPERKSGIGKILRFAILVLFVSECLFKLLVVIGRNRADFEILHAYVLSWFSVLSLPVAKLLKKKAIIEITLDGGMLDSLRSPSRNPIETFRRWALGKADCVITHSPYISSLALLAGLPEGKIFEVPNPVDICEYCPPTLLEKKRLRETLGIEQGAKVLLFVGGINERKGVDFLVEVFQFVAPHFPESILYLVGPTDKYNPRFLSRLEQGISESGLKGRIFFTRRRVKNAVEYMRASDIFVFASKQEGFGTVIVEAMACGLPVVVRNIPLITEHQIANGQEGVIVYGTEPEPYAEEVKGLLMDEQRINSIGKKAREKVLRNFSTEKVDQSYLGLWQRLQECHES